MTDDQTSKSTKNRPSKTVMPTDYPTGLVTLVFTDIQDSSALSERYGVAFEPVRAAHFRLLREAIERWRGREVSAAGDSLFLGFANATDAVQWAAEAQRALQRPDWQPPTNIGKPIDLRVRIGLHSGEPFVSADPAKRDYYGPPVNRAARVSAAGH